MGESSASLLSHPPLSPFSRKKEFLFLQHLPTIKLVVLMNEYVPDTLGWSPHGGERRDSSREEILGIGLDRTITL
jgi:hypothetical protein